MALGAPSIYPSVPSFPLVISRCETCGAYADEKLHEQWHEELRKQLLELFLAVPPRE